jgi:cell division protein FtsB
MINSTCKLPTSYHTIEIMTIKLHHALLGFFVFALVTSLARNGTTVVNNIPFYNQLKADYEKEKRRNNELKLDAVKARDPYEVEKLLRNKLGLIKANEQVIVIPNMTPTATPSSNMRPEP